MPKKLAQLASWWSQHQSIGWVLLVLLLIDRLTKRLTLAYLTEHPIVLAPYLQLNYVQNTGAAFGMMQGGNLLLILITLVIVGFLLKNWKEFCSYGRLAKWGLVFILGGALGNLYDRITLGFVVDFIDLRIWPVFNAADSFITIGGGMLVLTVLLTRKQPDQEEK